MPEHEHVRCARCGSGFECKVGTVHECQCFEVPLTRWESERIGEWFEDCLCKGCLRVLRDSLREAGPEVGPARIFSFSNKGGQSP